VTTDISAEMLAFGRERAAAAGLGNVGFMESDASRLDFPHASFDAAVSRWGIIFEPDAEAAAGRIRTSSSRARGWRSAHGGSPIRSPSSRFR
jgi:SAM-dependent methyltransferase